MSFYPVCTIMYPCLHWPLGSLSLIFTCLALGHFRPLLSSTSALWLIILVALQGVWLACRWGSGWLASGGLAGWHVGVWLAGCRSWLAWRSKVESISRDVLVYFQWIADRSLCVSLPSSHLYKDHQRINVDMMFLNIFYSQSLVFFVASTAVLSKHHP